MPHGQLFLDTSYVLGLYNTRDQWHEKAVELQRKLELENSRLATTEFVLAEICDALSSGNMRADGARIVRTLGRSELVDVIPAGSDLFHMGLRLYEERVDKDWGLTDCTSFVVMGDLGITDALSSDIHFRQAGFRPLLISDK